MEVLSKKMSVEEFFEVEIPDQAGFTYELINGILVRKNAPSGEHQFVQSRLFTLITKFTDAKDLGMVFSSPTSVILSEYDAPQPDLLFSDKKNMSRFDAQWALKAHRI